MNSYRRRVATALVVTLCMTTGAAFMWILRRPDVAAAFWTLGTWVLVVDMWARDVRRRHDGQHHDNGSPR